MDASKPPSAFGLHCRRWFTATVDFLVGDEGSQARPADSGFLHPLLRNMVLVYLDWRHSCAMHPPEESASKFAVHLIGVAYDKKVAPTLLRNL